MSVVGAEGHQAPQLLCLKVDAVLKSILFGTALPPVFRRFFLVLLVGTYGVYHKDPNVQHEQLAGHR